MAGTKSKWISRRLNFYNDGVEFTTGGYLHFKTGTYPRDDNVVATTAAGAITAYGISVLATGAAATYTLGTPQKGIRKVLIAHTTFAHTVRASSAVATGGIGVTGTTLHSVVLSPTTKTAALGGLSVKMVGMSTILWEVIGASTDNITYSTACT